jgi:hypothetical protein
MCYNLPAVESTVKQDLPPVQAKASPSPQFELAPGDDVSRYCPVCSQRLESRRCKLICTVCGYYMSCADYY